MVVDCICFPFDPLNVSSLKTCISYFQKNKSNTLYVLYQEEKADTESTEFHGEIYIVKEPNKIQQAPIL